MPKKTSITLQVDRRQLNQVGQLTKSGMARLEAALRRAVNVAALDVVHDTQVDMFSGNKTGRIYGDHQASAPGETPAVRTARLAGGFKINLAKLGNGSVATITNTVEYAEYLARMNRVIVLFESRHKEEFKQKVRDAVRKHLKMFSRKR